MAVATTPQPQFEQYMQTPDSRRRGLFPPPDHYPNRWPWRSSSFRPAARNTRPLCRRRGCPCGARRSIRLWACGTSAPSRARAAIGSARWSSRGIRAGPQSSIYRQRRAVGWFAPARACPGSPRYSSPSCAFEYHAIVRWGKLCSRSGLASAIVRTRPGSPRAPRVINSAPERRASRALRRRRNARILVAAKRLTASAAPLRHRRRIRAALAENWRRGALTRTSLGKAGRHAPAATTGTNSSEH